MVPFALQTAASINTSDLIPAMRFEE